jgi:hypothetical protein
MPTAAATAALLIFAKSLDSGYSIYRRIMTLANITSQVLCSKGDSISQ